MCSVVVSVTLGLRAYARRAPGSYATRKFLLPFLYLSNLQLYRGRSGGLRNAQGRYVGYWLYAYGVLAFAGALLFPRLLDHLDEWRSRRKYSWDITSGDVQLQHRRAKWGVQSDVDTREGA